MRVFADTNFLVSAFASRGLSADVFHLILVEHELVTGEFVLEELKRVLTVKLKLPVEIAIEADQLLRRHQVVRMPVRPSEIQVRDEDDRWVLESALIAKANVLITGDKDLLDVADKLDDPKIITPRGFWELVQRK